MNQVATVSPTSTALSRLSDNQLRTLKNTIAHDCDPNEFDLYMGVVKNTGLDPFRRQVIPLIFSKGDAAKRRMSIVISQDGLRTLAARCGDYRPAESEPEFELDASKVGATNPLGIVKCSTTLFKQDRQGAWHPVKGWAYWDEYAPIKMDSAEGFDWVETGEVWPDTQKPKKKKVPRGEVKPTLDASGQWAKMPRVMIAKCATMQALRAGWPDTFGGIYAEEELDRTMAEEVSASEAVERAETERRKQQVNVGNDEYPFADSQGTLQFVPAGNFARHIILNARNCASKDELTSMLTRNRESFQRFWAMHKADALDLKAEIEKVDKAFDKPKEKATA